MDLNLTIIAGSVDYTVDDESKEEKAQHDGGIRSFSIVKNLSGFVQRHVVLAAGGCHPREMM